MIRKPLPFEDALAFLLDKEQLPAEWDSAMWAAQEPDFRNKAFFSARVENARFLDRAQGFIFDYMARVREDVTNAAGEKSVALKIGSRADFVARMRDFMVSEGMASESEFPSMNQRDVTQLGGSARLKLIFDTNVKQAYGYGQWKQGMTPAVLRAFPAARLIRDASVREPRPRHQENLGEVLLKVDPRWAEFHNAKEIGGFEVPWGPYGFNSGVTQEDVSAREYLAMGGTMPDMEPDPSAITDNLQASVKTMDPSIKAKLKAELASRREKRSGNPTAKDYAREAATKNRRLADEHRLQIKESDGVIFAF